MDWAELKRELNINPFKTACFTGHRPEKFPFDTSEKLILDIFMRAVCLHSYDAVKSGYDTFFCGMQRGLDIWAGKQIIRLKEDFPHIRLICVSPYEKEILSRRGADKADYMELREACDRFISLQSEYSRECYQNRNRFMVDNSSLIIGAVADRKSGTGQTLAYARRKGLRVDEIDLNKFAEQNNLF